MRTKRFTDKRLPAKAALMLLGILMLLPLVGCEVLDEIGRKKMTDQDPDMPVPSTQEAQDYNPGSFDYELARQKGLIGTDDALSDKYLRLQAKYRSAFNEMLDSKGVLAVTDAAIDHSDLQFVPVAAEDYDVYQKYGSYGRKYIFLRNDFYIERLSAEDLELLDKASLEDSADLLPLVTRTYKDVIEVQVPSRDGSLDEEKGLTIVYQMDYFGLQEADSHAVVLKIINREKFDEQGNEDYEAEKKKWQALQAVRDELQAQLTKQLGHEVVVFYSFWD
jgi:hypothetical protein